MKGAADSSGAISLEVRQQAAEWLVELQASAENPGASDDTRSRWQEWRAAHPDHERAWQCIESFGGRLQAIPSPLAQAALAKVGSTDSPKRRQAIKTLVVLLFAGGVAWYGRDATPLPQWMADVSTGLGERRSLTLADGTRIELSASTSIDIRYSNTQRLLRLVGGEILVTTAHETVHNPAANDGKAARPFIVETTHGRIRALGTRFVVRQIDSIGGESMGIGGATDASQVSVFEGAVAIQLSHGVRDPADAERVLNAGQQARFTRETISAAEPADETSTAWIQGMIVAQDMLLADFVAELARYATGSSLGRLRCDPAVARLKVSGTYPLANLDKTLDMLQTALPIRARQLRRWWGGAEVVLMAR